MCAALNAAGAVDGCATSDGDALLFGAKLQFKMIRLQAEIPTNCKIERCDAAEVREKLGLVGRQHEGVSSALVALALLAGGDYDPGGAKQVGGTLAMRVVRSLAAEEAKQHKRGGGGGGAGVGGGVALSLPERLDAFLAAAPDPDLEALSTKGCTGCARCKHDGGGKSRKKSHSAKHGCPCCHTSSGCLERPGPCECPFHAQEEERWMDRVRRRARSTQGYAGSFQRAARAYAAQAAEAAKALSGAPDLRGEHICCGGSSDGGGCGGGIIRRLRWTRRPDAKALAALLEELCDVPARRGREKVLPLLLEWDMRAVRESEARSGGLEGGARDNERWGGGDSQPLPGVRAYIHVIPLLSFSFIKSLQSFGNSRGSKTGHVYCP